VALQKVFEMLMGGGLPGAKPMPSGARPVSPTPQPAKTVNNPSPTPVVEDDDSEEEDDEESVTEGSGETEDIEATEDTEAVQESEDELDPMQEIPRVASFFEYLKGAIESKKVSYEEAAKEATLRLSPQIVDFLKQVDDSSLVIAQLQPLLMSVCGPELTSFYFEATTVEWMNKMLAVLRGEVVKEEEEEVEVKVPPPAPAPAKTPKVSAPKVEKPAPKVEKPAEKPKRKYKVKSSEAKATKSETKPTETKTSETTNS